MKRVLITNAVPADVLEPLAGLAEVVQGPAGGDLMSREEVLRLGPTLDGIINQAELRVDAELLDQCPRLRVIANVAAGTDNLDGDLMASRGIWGCNAPGAFFEATADLTLAFLLMLARRVPAADAFVRSGRWQGFQPGLWDGDLLSGRTLGIVGYGRIGRAVAVRARAFGLKVIYCDSTSAESEESRSLESLLAEADYVSMHVPLLPQTRGMMNAARFARMKKGARFLNLSRGQTMVEADLVDALVSGHLAGAALDVFEHEPKVHPVLCTLPNVILTPHIGGGTVQTRRTARRLAAENVALVLRGEAPLTPINRLEPLHS